ncbi:tRNA dihydrouridine synthase DusB [Effusibacillus dendaii]|uniref:tRNA-dihydrouridine synthase n=1 Tax=Effusibacillus dendaii TaxID=2743772 RepID=A0A7I8DBL3_9BACL|nr:tRNA dihydrouridine synthase DusB [Effusibacillus dendaii]BCJ87377.1 putative tRNA-dihydrouridine synthase 1 [Effusibacillus dendaii]
MAFKIGEVEMENQVVLAPMAGVCNPPFRKLVKEMGAGLVCAEMVSDKAIVHGNEKTRLKLGILPEEHPVSLQLVGCDIESMVKAAELVMQQEFKPDIIDINMGCPATKIHKNGSGAALARDPEVAGRIIEAVVKTVDRPVTVKFRKGWDEQNINAVQVAKAAEQAGAKAVAVHGRTARQLYTGRADWDIIRQVKEAVSIPVIGNGDVTTPQLAQEMLQSTGCDAVMIGRGAHGNPWIFKQVAHFLETGKEIEPPSAEERIRVCLRHMDLLIEHKGEFIAVKEMRKHAAWYIKGLYNSAELRNLINEQATRDGMRKTLLDYLDFLTQKNVAV